MTDETHTELLSADETSILRAMLLQPSSDVAKQALVYLNSKDNRRFWKKILFRVLEIVGMLCSVYIGGMHT